MNDERLAEIETRSESNLTHEGSEGSASDALLLLAEVRMLRSGVVYKTVLDSIDMLDAAGGLDGTHGNTLWAMTKTACEELAKLRGFARAAVPVLRYQAGEPIDRDQYSELTQAAKSAVALLED